MSAGINMNVNFSTNNGMDFGISAKGSSQTATSSVNGEFGQTYNSREGLKYNTFGVSGSGTVATKSTKSGTMSGGQGMSVSTIPISSQNFVPVITNASSTSSTYFQLKVGIERVG